MSVFMTKNVSCIKNYRFQLFSLVDFKQPLMEARKKCHEYHVLNQMSTMN